MVAIAEISRAEFGDYWLRSPYDAKFVYELKATLPGFARNWDPERKLWLIDGLYVKNVIGIARRFYKRVVYPENLLPGKADGNSLEQLYLTKDAPPEVVKAVYRTLAKLHHPDKGGKTETMQAINLAYEKLVQADDGAGGPP